MPRSSKKKADIGHADKKITVRTDTPPEMPTLDPLEEEAIKRELESYQIRRKLGEEKPKEVSWADWKGHTEMTPQHFMMAQMCAMGMKPGEIAYEMQVSASRVSTILRNKLTKAYITKLQRYFTTDAKRRFERLVPNAVTCFEEVLAPHSQEQTKMKVDVATKVMDRAWGRAQNDVQDAGNTVLNLLRGLKDLNESGPRDPMEGALEVSSHYSSVEGERSEPRVPAPFSGNKAETVADLLNTWEEGNNESSEEKEGEEDASEEE